MSESKEHTRLRFQAVVIASQLPDNKAEALLVLDYARRMVVEFLDDPSGVPDVSDQADSVGAAAVRQVGHGVVEP